MTWYHTNKIQSIHTSKLRDELTEKLDILVIELDLIFTNDAFGRRFRVRIFHFKRRRVRIILQRRRLAFANDSVLDLEAGNEFGRKVGESRRDDSVERSRCLEASTAIVQRRLQRLRRAGNQGSQVTQSSSYRHHDRKFDCKEMTCECGECAYEKTSVVVVFDKWRHGNKYISVWLFVEGHLWHLNTIICIEWLSGLRYKIVSTTSTKLSSFSQSHPRPWNRFWESTFFCSTRKWDPLAGTFGPCCRPRWWRSKSSNWRSRRKSTNAREPGRWQRWWVARKRSATAFSWRDGRNTLVDKKTDKIADKLMTEITMAKKLISQLVFALHWKMRIQKTSWTFERTMNSL